MLNKKINRFYVNILVTLCISGCGGNSNNQINNELVETKSIPCGYDSGNSSNDSNINIELKRPVAKIKN